MPPRHAQLPEKLSETTLLVLENVLVMVRSRPRHPNSPLVRDLASLTDIRFVE
jgi:hypothetical protein